MARKSVKQLYYITHIANLASILGRGIMSHQQMVDRGIPYQPIYDAEIVANRHARLAPNGDSLWRFANLYFQPRNAMLYRVLLQRRLEEVVVLGIRPDVLARPDAFMALGNAASVASDIVPSGEAKRVVPEILKWAENDWWTEEVGLKRKMMAECLVPDEVPADLIKDVYVGSYESAAAVRQLISDAHLVGTQPEVVLEPRMFFAPARSIALTPLLSVAEGDMFFSKMQTLTVSVNCVGVMGKGLASRAKYQFPDVYVRYQDVCRAKRLRMGHPYLYKRETSLDYQLAADPMTLTETNGETWFLLFPTKRHWRDTSDIGGIQEGLQWVADNYKDEGIQSLAMPALGCGLGRLEWRDVGPLMCRYLSQMDVETRVYLPAEKKVPDQLLTKEFLLPTAVAP